MNKISEDFKAKYNNRLRYETNRIIKRELGVEVDMTIDEYGRLTDTMDDVNKKMRGNKILRQLFKTANLYGHAYDFGNNTTIAIRIGYTHMHGGSNGNEMMVLYFDDERKKVAVSK